ncbi:MAG: class I SAM-dependent methyltransferase [Deltaproteobacteria bacterium]|nr:class I SAM-dependent methyltransferase [Deltaproteobacteria bacterium]
MSDDFDPTRGQEGLEDHYEQWFAHIASDFRATNLNRLVVDLVPRGLVLDIGCGSGALTAELIRSGREVVAQDASERMVALTERHLASLGLAARAIRLGTVESLAERGAFDGVVALDVIEHIEDDRAALETMRAALRPDGRLVLSVPALPWLYGPKDVAVGHYRRYDKTGLLGVLEQAGFEVLGARYWNALGVAPVWLMNRRGARLDESVRYSASPAKRALNTTLSAWFRYVENPLRPPLGMTLLVHARPR